MLQLYFTCHSPHFFKGTGRVLHFAPESHIRKLIEQNPDYQIFSCDYARAMIECVPAPRFQSDMQDMPLADNCIDIVFCLHVLEHVPDDGLGLGEIRRIMKSGGVAYIMVPFMMGWSETREFGKPDPLIFDHVRGYSPVDFRERLSGFSFEEILPSAFLSTDEMKKFGIPHDSQVIYICRKGE